MPRVYVARAFGRRQHVDGPLLVGRHTHRSAEGSDGDVHVVAQLGGGSVPEVEVADVRVGEVRREQAEAGQDGAPTPRTWLQLEDLDFECVAGLGAANVDRTSERVEPVEVQLTELGRGVALGELAGRDLFSVEMDDVAGDDLNGRRQRGVPFEMEGLAADPVLLDTSGRA